MVTRISTNTKTDEMTKNEKVGFIKSHSRLESVTKVPSSMLLMIHQWVDLQARSSLKKHIFGPHPKPPESNSLESLLSLKLTRCPNTLPGLGTTTSLDTSYPSRAICMVNLIPAPIGFTSLYKSIYLTLVSALNWLDQLTIRMS